MRRNRLFLLSLMTVLLVSILCSTAMAGRKSTLVVAKDAEPLLLDPHNVSDIPSMEVVYAIYEGLVTFDEEMNVRPALATDWEVSEDGLTWTFHLRKDVSFHSGSKFDAHAVKVTFDRLLKTKTRQSRLFVPFVEKFEVKDDYTVVFTLKKPFGGFLSYLCHTGASIVDPRDIESGRDFRHTPSGTGAFRLDEWEQGEYISLAANEDYWGGKPRFKEVLFKIIPENSTRSMMVETGEADVAESVPMEEVERLQKNRKLDILVKGSLGMQFMGINTKDEVLKDIRIRKAIWQAIDRDSIIRNICRGYVDKEDALVSKMVVGCPTDFRTQWKYDPERSRELLAEAGWTDTDGDGYVDKDGQKLTINFRTHAKTELAHKVPVATQSYLANVGIDVKVQTLDWGTFLSVTKKPLEENTNQLTFSGIGCSTGFADWAYRPLTLKAKWPPKGINRVFFSAPGVPELIEKGAAEMDPEVRKSIYGKIQQIVDDNVAWMPLYSRKIVIAVRKDVKGLKVLPMRFLVVDSEAHRE